MTVEQLNQLPDLNRLDTELWHRNAVLGAITYAATRIITAADWRLVMSDVLERLGTAIEVSRATLCENHSTGLATAQIHRFGWSVSYIGPAIRRDPPVFESRDEPSVEHLEQLGRGEVLQIVRSHTTGNTRQWLENEGALSILLVPVFVENSFWGSLNFVDCRTERIRDHIEIDLLKTAATIIAGGIERARADERLRERDNLLIGAQRIAQMGSWMLDFETESVSWSEEGWRIFGFESAPPAWTHVDNLQRIHPDDRAKVAELDARARDSGEPFEVEYRIIRPNGEVRILRERADIVRDADGHAGRLVGIVHDITEAKLNEARLRESEERYALAASGAGVGLWDWHIDSDTAYFSPQLHEMLAVVEGGLGRSFARFLEQLLPEDRVALLSQLQENYSQNRDRFEFEVRSLISNNKIRWFVIRGLIVYSDGKPIRLVGSLGDITDRKRALEEIVRQREALYQNDKMAMLGSLLAGVAHELNNPLSVVTGQVALLEQTAKDPAVLKRAERIQKATERCARIVRTFLAIARQRDRQAIPVKIGSVIETVVELLAFQLRASDIQMDIDLADDIPDFLADTDQIHLLLTNLIVNACQALSSSPRPRVIRICAKLPLGGNDVHISVSDNGPGVPAANRKRIFDAFFTTKPAGEGTGIGLSLCLSIVRSHGGTITVADNPGGGAMFNIKLPLKTGEPLAELDRDERRLPAGVRVLIVEDDKEIADILDEILRSHGHQTRIALDGRDGLDMALSRNFDLILSDMRLPNLDGMGLYNALQRKRPNLLNRLAFITGDTLSTDIQCFLRETGAPCLEKPFRPADILNLISRLVSR